MAHRLITAVCKADLNLKRALFSGNFNILSQLSSHPPKGSDKPLNLNQNNGNNSGACTAGGIGADRKSSSLSGGADGRAGDEEKSKGGPGSDGKNKTRIFIGTASILGVCWVYLNQKDFNWKGAVDNFGGVSTVECKCALAIPDVKSKPDETLQKEPNAIDQETTDGGNEKLQESDPVDLAQLVNAAKSTDPQIQCSAVNSLCELLYSGRKPPIDFLISCNILPTLFDCLNSPNPALQFDALRALGKIVNEISNQHPQAVIEAGVVPHFLRLLTSPHQNVPEHAIIALAGMIVDCVIKLGLVAALLNFIQPDTSITFLQQVALGIATPCFRMDPPPPHETVLEILPILNALVDHDDSVVLYFAVGALMCLMEGGKEQIQMVIDSGVLPKLVQLLNYRGGDEAIAARVVSAIIVTGTHDQAQAVLKCVAPSHLHNLLEHPNKTFCTLAMCFLEICVYENFATVQSAIDAGLIPRIVHHLEKGELQTQKVAAYVLRTMTARANKHEVANLIDCGVIPSCCNLLNCKDSEVIQFVLGGIYNILAKLSVDQGDGDKAWTLIKECGGLDKIKMLQDHENMEISEIAQIITLMGSLSEDYVTIR